MYGVALVGPRLAFAGFRERWHAYAVMSKNISECSNEKDWSDFELDLRLGVMYLYIQNPTIECRM